MKKIIGWVGLWIYTEAVVCNGQRHTQTFRINDLEAVTWVCDDALDEHVWVSEQTKVDRCKKLKFWRPCNMTLKSRV